MEKQPDITVCKQEEGGPGAPQGYPQQGFTQPGYPQQGFTQPGYPQNPTQHQQQYPFGTNVVVTQPTTFGSKPNDYFVFSLLTCLFCFWPTGIAALIFSCNSREASDRMDYKSAESNGQTAKIFSIVSLVLGLLWIIGTVIWAIVYATSVTTTYIHYG